MTKRAVQKTITGMPTSDGAGVQLVRIIGQPRLDMLDPFLLLDCFSSDDPDDYIAGFPDHPHRGFETVTYLLSGKMRHRDNSGREGLLTAGGVQWMTAGSGIIHSEMPEQEDGLLQGFQLWVNLPAKDKMSSPYYQEFEPEQVPVEEGDGATIRVIAGATDDGTIGPVQGIPVDPLYLDISLQPNRNCVTAVTRGHNAFVYVIDGSIDIGGSVAGAGELVILTDGDNVELQNSNEPGRLLLVAARPLNEPVERAGPFVMNTRNEILQAFADYRAGKF